MGCSIVFFSLPAVFRHGWLQGKAANGESIHCGTPVIGSLAASLTSGSGNLPMLKFKKRTNRVIFM